VRSTFGAETHAAADGVEIGKLIAYTMSELVSPGISAEGILQLEATGKLPMPLHLITDCKSLLDALVPDETQVPSESSMIMVLLQLKESLKIGTIKAITHVDTRDMLADALNKGSIARGAIREAMMSGTWLVRHPVTTHFEKIRAVILPETERPLELQKETQLQ
jgi:hypothetical protein